ncbi:MAG: hypothetical protein Q7R57_05005 [Dehalococcoidales bacterium]|nr:hypothetical protein [Dehalococcoidales bacterium]
MSGYLSAMRSSARWQVAFRLFLVTLCLLIIFAPRLSEPAQAHPSDLSISTTTPNFTFLANNQRGDGDPYRVRNTSNDAYRLPPATAIDLLYAHLFASTSSIVSVRINLFDSICLRNFHQACHFLDLPPPALVS